MYYFLRMTGWLVCRAKPKTLEKITRLLSLLWFDIFRFRRQLILSNLERALGDSLSPGERKQYARTSIQNFLMTLFEVFYSQENPIIENIEIEGSEIIRQALAQGQGAYILCCHLGNWEAMGAMFSTAFCPSHVLVKKIGVAGVNRYTEERRKINGFIGMQRKKKGDAYRQIKEALGKNEIIGFVMDQARPGEPKLEFFGHPAKTNTSFAAIHEKAAAPIIPSFMVRRGFNQHTLHIWPQVELPSHEDQKQEILQRSEYLNQVVEKMIMAKPDQYFWLHDRWKN
jgi:Kdo2-lipid IVA lauroyltransferase/acyltransferase